MHEQQTVNRELGVILVKMGALDPAELAGVLAIQNDTAQLDDALKLAAGVRQRLGELLAYVQCGDPAIAGYASGQPYRRCAFRTTEPKPNTYAGTRSDKPLRWHCTLNQDDFGRGV